MIDDAQDGHRGELVGAEMAKVRRQARCQQAITAGEIGGVEEPGQDQDAIGTGRERNGVEDDGNSDALLWSRFSLREL